MALSLAPVIAHRGDRKYAPENTLVAIAQAARKGAIWVEFDASLTRDTGKPVVLFHDDEVGRTTSLRNRPLVDVGFDELRAADAGSWFSDSFVGERVPTLTEAIELCDKHKLGMNIEIKVSSNGDRTSLEPFDEALARLAARRVIEDIRAVRGGNWSNILLSSLSGASLLAALELEPAVPRSYKIHTLLPDDIADDRLPELRKRLKLVQPQVLQINQELLSSPARVERFQNLSREVLGRELPLFAYTVNDPVRYRKLLEWKVFGVLTDMPGDLLNPSRDNMGADFF